MHVSSTYFRNVRRRRWYRALSPALRHLRGSPMPALAAPSLRSPGVRRHRQAAPVVPRGEFTPRSVRAQPLFAGCTGPSVCLSSAAGRAAPATTERRAFPAAPLARAPGARATRLMLGHARGPLQLCRCSPPRPTGRSRRTSVSVRPTRLENGVRSDNDAVQLTNSWTRWKHKTVASAGATAAS